ncbi:MAG: FAD-binding and (Fe-S)-binding domain-containing protein [Actinomycetes bacterium]
MTVKSSRVALPQPEARLTTLLRQAVMNPEDVSTDALERVALAVDASHYLMTPQAVVRARSARDVAGAMAAARTAGVPLTLRSGGSSLSGQALTDGVAVDVRRHFRRIDIHDHGKRVTVQPGATIREVNTRLARHHRKLGPDPVSEIACTIGGMVANNSSGMTCGTVANTYRTVESMTIVLPSGTVVDTASPDADALLRQAEPTLVEVLTRLHEQFKRPDLLADIHRRYRIKNTMGYGLNSLVDFDTPAKMLEHLMVGSEGTLGFVAEATFRTVPVLPKAATGLLLFPNLDAATRALPSLVASGAPVVELLDAAALRATADDTEKVLPGLVPTTEAALLVEYQAELDEELDELVARAHAVFDSLDLARDPELSRDPGRRALLWVLRKGTYTKVAANRPAGTAALLEDVAVPMERLGGVCSALQGLFDKHDYPDAVIFGHAKDGNIHFLVTEDFATQASMKRYEDFTEEMVELVLATEGTLKAEHGTGRIMAPFVHRQYGDELYAAMWDIKRACDPALALNPGAVLTEDPQLHLKNVKTTPVVREVIDRCVECGYCEPVCPSQHLTTTPRQRIVIQRAIAVAEASGQPEVAAQLRKEEQYPVIDTCAVDGMCQTACPVKINTGDLVRDLRTERNGALINTVWGTAAKHWDGFNRIAAVGMSVVDKVPTPLVRGALGIVRKVTSDDLMWQVSDELPGGGKVRRPVRTASPDAVFLPACVQTMFASGHPSRDGSESAVHSLASIAGLALRVPDDVASLCCGTVWKSKGLTEGRTYMSDRLAGSLRAATEDGLLPVVCDNASCTEGIEISLRAEGLGHLRVLDATSWVAEYVAPHLPPLRRVRRAIIHPTCSSTRMGINDALTVLSGLLADEVVVPDGWRCCAFAGDRGLLHEELTATATRDEAASVAAMDADLYLSCNRTCELGMTRATGRTYTHVIEELAARVLDVAGTHR